MVFGDGAQRELFSWGPKHDVCIIYVSIRNESLTLKCLIHVFSLDNTVHEPREGDEARAKRGTTKTSVLMPLFGSDTLQ